MRTPTLLAALVAVAVFLPSAAAATELVITRAPAHFEMGDARGLDDGWEEESEADKPLSPTRERIIGGIKIGAGSGLLGAGAALTALSIYAFVSAGTYGGIGASTSSSVLGLTAGVFVGLGIGAATGATICIIVGAVLLNAGIAHVRRARSKAGLDRWERRYASAERRNVRWGVRFAAVPPTN